jgi:cation diffusion facilitator family transporter
VAGGSQKAVVAAFFANLAIAVSKFIGFFITGAASMLAEAVHSVADTSNQGLLLNGSRKARRQPTPMHPFGYARERYFWSFVVAVVLFAGGGLFALYEAEEKLRHPHELESVTVAVVILVAAIVIESFSLRVAVRESAHAKGEESWWGFIRHSKSAELPVVLLEDIGALLGLVFALVGVALAEVTDNPRWDALGSLAIGVLLVVISLTLAAEMKSLLIGESASPATQERIKGTIEADPRVRRLIHMRTQQLGPEELMVAARIELEGGLAVTDAATVINDVETAVRAAVPDARVMYLEPDFFVAERAAPPAT